MDFNIVFDSSRCDECGGKCCIGESGNIWLTPSDIENISLYLGINITKLKNLYLDKIRYRFSLKEIKISKQKL